MRNRRYSTSSTSSPSGQILVQLLIGLGVISIIMVGAISMISRVQIESKAVSEKLAALNLESVLRTALGDGAVCRYVLNTPARLTFDSRFLPQTITLPRPAPLSPPVLYASVIGGVPGPALAQVGSTIGGSQAAVSSIQLTITQGSAGNYQANWYVNFDPATVVRNLRPATVPVRLSVDDVTDPSRATINDCWGGSGRASGITTYTMYWDQTNTCRTSPTAFSKSVKADWTSLGDLSTGFLTYGSALFEMTIRASSPTTVTQVLRQIYNQIYFYLNGVQIAAQATAGLQYQPITWRFMKGENLVQIVANNCGGGGPNVELIGDFFTGHPQLQFLR